MYKGDFYVVEYLGWETTYTEIVASERLRPKSNEPPITNRTFFSFSIRLPEDIKNFYGYLPEEKHPELHNDFKSAINAAKVEFSKEDGVLKVLSKDEASEKKAGLLQVRLNLFILTKFHNEIVDFSLIVYYRVSIFFITQSCFYIFPILLHKLHDVRMQSVYSKSALRLLMTFRP